MTDSVSNTDELDPRDAAAAPFGSREDEETPPDSDAPDAEAVEVESSDGETPAHGEPDADVADQLEAAPDGAPEGTSIEEELLALREDFDALNDRHLRLAAEFNNYRRRVEQERLDLWTRAQADLLAKLLDVLDDLQRVADLDLESATVEAIMEGIDLVERKFAGVLGDVGVEVVDPLGEIFDPEVMEAMMQEPAASDEDDDRVARVLQKGYRLKGQLVRAARVSVYKHG